MIAADAGELAGLERHLRPTQKLAWPFLYARQAVRAGRRWILTANGAGPKNARVMAEHAARHLRVSLVVSTGLCGALDPGLRVNDIFVPGRIVDLDSGTVFRTADDNTATLASGDRVLTTPSEKSFVRDLTGASAVDMEAGAVAVVAGDNNWPMRCIRVVSDTAEEGFALDLNAARDSSGRFQPGKILLSALSTPHRGIPELWHLSCRARQASRVLGDYLARYCV